MSGHRVLVVEDDPVAQRDIGELLASRGDSVRFAATVEEALVAIEEEDLCLLVVDQQLPARSGDRALVSGGERVMTEFRAKDDRRNARGRHVTPIVACTKYAEHHEFVSLMHDLGADAFYLKPVHEAPFLDKVRATLEKAGRETHANCAALKLPRVARGGGVRLHLDGEREGRRTGVLFNGERRFLQDALFFVLFRFGVAHDRAAGSWSSRDALGLGYSRDTLSAIRKELAGLAPEGFELIEADHSKNFRLNPAVVVEVAWEALEKHPHEGIQRVAKERGGRK